MRKRLAIMLILLAAPLAGCNAEAVMHCSLDPAGYLLREHGELKSVRALGLEHCAWIGLCPFYPIFPGDMACGASIVIIDAGQPVRDLRHAADLERAAPAARRLLSGPGPDLAIVADCITEHGKYADTQPEYWIISNDPLILAEGTTHRRSDPIPELGSPPQRAFNLPYTLRLISQNDLAAPAVSLVRLDQWPVTMPVSSDPHTIFPDDLLTRQLAPHVTRNLLPPGATVGQLLHDPSLWNATTPLH